MLSQAVEPALNCLSAAAMLLLLLLPLLPVMPFKVPAGSSQAWPPEPCVLVPFTLPLPLPTSPQPLPLPLPLPLTLLLLLLLRLAAPPSVPARRPSTAALPCMCVAASRRCSKVARSSCCHCRGTGRAGLAPSGRSCHREEKEAGARGPEGGPGAWEGAEVVEDGLEAGVGGPERGPGIWEGAEALGGGLTLCWGAPLGAVAAKWLVTLAGVSKASCALAPAFEGTTPAGVSEACCAALCAALLAHICQQVAAQPMLARSWEDMRGSSA